MLSCLIFFGICETIKWCCHALIGPPQKQSPRTVHDDMDGPPGPSITTWMVPPDRLCRHGRAIWAIYELPSSNEDQMEFRYKHWCGRAERGRTRAPPCRCYSGGTEYDEGRPYISAIDGLGGPIITGDHLTRDSSSLQSFKPRSASERDASLASVTASMIPTCFF